METQEAAALVGQMMSVYPNISMSEMATEDMMSVVANADVEKLESLHMCLNALNGMGEVKIITDMPRDGVNFNFHTPYIYGGMILKSGKYDLYS